VLDVYAGNLDELPLEVLAKKLDSASGYRYRSFLFSYFVMETISSYVHNVLPKLTFYCSQSKLISEELVRRAFAKSGVPALVFRPCDISGDTKSGYSNVKDSISIIVSGIAKLGTPLPSIFFHFL
jgi:hypothetical protein